MTELLHYNLDTKLRLVFNINSVQQEVNTETETEAEVQEEIVSENKPPPPETPAVSNGIIFRDAQGNLLSESEKDSLVENINLQALRRFDDELNNTEYILFENYEDRGNQFKECVRKL